MRTTLAALQLVMLAALLQAHADDAPPDAGAAPAAAAAGAPPSSAPPETLPTIPVPQEPAAVPSARHDEPVALENITVSASKRAEPEREVAGAVTAMTGEHLAEIGASNFKDYLTLIPGVQFNDSDPGYSLVTMRGVSTTNDVQQNQTPVGIFYNEVPLTDPFGAIEIPDIDAFDMTQVEVMRGPQGALFGAGALGGAINYIPHAPDSRAFAFSLDGSADIGKDRRIGRALKGMVNVPLIEDQAALRASGYTNAIPGYIDNIGTGRNDSNSHQLTGARVAASYAPLFGTTITAEGLYQRTFIGDLDYATTTYGEMKKASNFPESATLDMDMEDLHLDSDFGFARLVGIASYQHKSLFARQDSSYALPSIAFGPGTEYDAAAQVLSTAGPVEGDLAGHLHGYTGELRLVSPDSDFFEWLAGGYFGRRTEHLAQRQFLTNVGALDGPATDLLAQLLPPSVSDVFLPALLPDGNLVITAVDLHSRELAAYFDGTLKFLSYFKLQAGGRLFWNRLDSLNHEEGVLSVASTDSQSVSRTAAGSQAGHGFNPKASFSYMPNDDLLFYFLYARGFTLGGVNVEPPEPGFTIPPSYGPNVLHNFELGAKTAWFGKRLLLDVTPYYMKWYDIPLELLSPMGRAYLDNVGNARNYGIEVSLTARPLPQLVVISAPTFLRAKLVTPYNSAANSTTTQIEAVVVPSLSPSPIPAGTPLPGAPHFQIGNQVLYNWYTDLGRFHAVLLHRYIGRSPGTIQHTEVLQGGFHTFGVRGGWSQERLSLDLFCNNLLDKRGVSRATYIVGSRINQSIIQPRTIGLEMGFSFP
jgi:outer membrane receptor protein involved in Fe transport